LTSTVLLIGRHTGVLASLVERLARRGHRVMLAWNSRDGARLAEAANPDLVVIDRPEAQRRDVDGLRPGSHVVHVDSDRRPGQVAVRVEQALGL
jgi:NAD(P)-dependent dehydrogenase (short-subunit alcohol dehydrogenase family)